MQLLHTGRNRPGAALVAVTWKAAWLPLAATVREDMSITVGLVLPVMVAERPVYRLAVVEPGCAATPVRAVVGALERKKL